MRASAGNRFDSEALDAIAMFQFHMGMSRKPSEQFKPRVSRGASHPDPD